MQRWLQGVSTTGFGFAWTNNEFTGHAPKCVEGNATFTVCTFTGEPPPRQNATHEIETESSGCVPAASFSQEAEGGRYTSWNSSPTTN